MKLTAESTVFNDEKVQNKFAELIVDTDGIRTEVGKKVGNNEIISRINQSAESVSIDAGKVNISGVITAINNNTTTSIDGDKIATGSLSADRVDANSGTFNTANIPNLNASKITAGDISADRMKANSITAINSLTTGKINAARLDVSSITVGSLKDGSSYSTTSQMNTAISGAIDDINVGGRNLLRMTPKVYDQDAYKTYELYLTENLVSGETYTLQLWGVNADSNSEGIQPYWGGGSISLTPMGKPDSKKYWCKTFTVGTNTSTNAWINIYNRPNGHSGMSLSITKWKLEKGNKATDWTPAPEDAPGTNLLCYPYFRQTASGSPYTINGITFTLNKNGSVTAKGTATANAWYQFTSSQYPHYPNGQVCLPAGTYTISGCPAGGSSSTYSLRLGAYSLSDGATSLAAVADYGNGRTITLDQAALIRFEFVIMNGHACPSAGLTFRPMLEVGEIAHRFSSPSATAAAAESATKYITRITDDGIRIHPASTQNNSAVINANGMEIFKGGTGSANSIAFYGDTARIGKTSDAHISMTSRLMTIDYKSDGAIATIGALNDANGLKSITYRNYNISASTISPLKFRVKTLTSAEYADGTTASVTISSDGYTLTIANRKAQELILKYVTDSPAPVYEIGKRKSGSDQGLYSLLTGYDNTVANGQSAAVGGEFNSITNTDAAAIAGSTNIVDGLRSVTLGGINLLANGVNQVVMGHYNVGQGNRISASGTDNAFIIGNGSSSARSNAFAVRWDGNINSSRYGITLWNGGTGGYQMTDAASQKVTFSNGQKISDQLTGIILVWSAWENSAVQNYNFDYQFVPKWHVINHNGSGVEFIMKNNGIASNVICTKYLYIYDTYITGNAKNDDSGTGYANDSKVLRAVIGV